MSQPGDDEVETTFLRTVPVETGETAAFESEPTLARPLDRPVTTGDVIDGRYRLARAIGRGGMGRVFLADHLMLGTKVAIKFMHPHLTRDRMQVARFAREARAAALLKSEHVARIMDVAQLPSGEMYIVMEYLEGAGLDVLAHERGGLPPADALAYLAQACDALAEAHDRGILHRDVKPANLFLTKDSSGNEVVKVLDFGLAKILASNGSSNDFSMATGVKEAVGTPHYMAPEQITGLRPVDARADIWGIGATLYELLTGELAYPGKTAPAVFDLVLKSKPPPLEQRRPDVPPAVVAIVERCLEQDADDRYPSVRDLIEVLETVEIITKRLEPVPRSVPPPRGTMPMAMPVEAIRATVPMPPPPASYRPPPPTVRPPAPIAPPKRAPLGLLLLILATVVAAVIGIELMRRR